MHWELTTDMYIHVPYEHVKKILWQKSKNGSQEPEIKNQAPNRKYIQLQNCERDNGSSWTLAKNTEAKQLENVKWFQKIPNHHNLQPDQQDTVEWETSQSLVKDNEWLNRKKQKLFPTNRHI